MFNDFSDDIFFFNGIILGMGIGSSWIVNDINNIFGNYNILIFFGFYFISGGLIDIIIMDGDDFVCINIFFVDVLLICFDFCNLNLVNFFNIICNDSGMFSDLFDDIIQFIFNFFG